MCGIAGILSLTGAPVSHAEKRVAAMTRLLHQRGPDGVGWRVSPDRLLALGATRLAVTDPSAPIGLPMVSETGSDMLAFNGEIYDYKAVRGRLESRGVRFRSNTDTEVLLEALRAYGDTALETLDGMWALAHYCAATRRLLLSRDVMGERHLFYRVRAGELVFASEPRALLIDRAQPEELNMEAVASAVRYYSAPPGLTLVKGIRRLLPGHNIVARPGSEIVESRYRRLHPERWHDYFAAGPSDASVVEKFDELMHDVTAARLPPDSPYLATLSGGIDSALICDEAARGGQSRISTLYARSQDRAPGSAGEFDERDASRFISRHLGTEHFEIGINGDECVPSLLDAANDGFDGVIDPGVASFRMLAAAVRQRNRKVILVSDGPDELAGGYPVDREARRWDNLESDSRARYRLLRLASRTRIGRSVLDRLGRRRDIVPIERSGDPFGFLPFHSANGRHVLRDLGLPYGTVEASWGYGREDSAYAAIRGELDPTQRRALSYASYSLPEMINRRTDKAFFAEGVEARNPFQAPDMVDFLIALRPGDRFGAGNETKRVLRTAVAQRLGPEIANRRKHGFSAQLFDTPRVYASLNVEDTLRDTRLFEDQPFAPGARDYILRQRGRKLRWMFFVLARTWEQMRVGRYTMPKAFAPSARHDPRTPPEFEAVAERRVAHM